MKVHSKQILVNFTGTIIDKFYRLNVEKFATLLFNFFEESLIDNISFVSEKKSFFNYFRQYLAFLQVQKRLKEKKITLTTLTKQCHKKRLVFFFYIYKNILKTRLYVYTENLWLNSSKKEIHNFSSFLEIKILNIFLNKKIITLISILWLMFEIFWFDFHQTLFYSKSHLLKSHISTFQQKILCTYSIEFYSFLLFFFYSTFSENHLLKQIKNKGDFWSLAIFKKKQLIKKFLLQLILYDKQSTLTNYYDQLGRTVYDCIQSFYEVLQNDPKYIVKTQIFSNCFIFFNPQVYNYLTTRLFDFDNLGISDFFYCFLYKFQTFSQAVIHQTIHLLKPKLFFQVEKKTLNYYYRQKSKYLLVEQNSFKLQYKIFQVSNLYICLSNNQKNIFEFFLILKTCCLNYGLFFPVAKFFHSSSYFMNEKPGLDFQGFFLIQKMTKKENQLLKVLSGRTKFYKNMTFKQLKSLFLIRIDLLLLKKSVIKNKLILSGTNKTYEEIYKTEILPSKFYLMKYFSTLKDILKKCKVQSQEVLIKEIKASILIWCSYYKIISNKKIFAFCDSILFSWIWKWSCRRHPTKNRQWIKKKYFYSFNSKKWSFCTYQKSANKLFCLPEHRQTKLIRYIKVALHCSVHDENWKYWFKRIEN